MSSIYFFAGPGRITPFGKIFLLTDLPHGQDLTRPKPRSRAEHFVFRQLCPLRYKIQYFVPRQKEEDNAAPS